MFNSREFFEKEMGKKWVDCLEMPKCKRLNSGWFSIVNRVVYDLQEHNFGKILLTFSVYMSGKQLFRLLDRYVEEGTTTYDTWVNICKVFCKQYLPEEIDFDELFEATTLTAEEMCNGINEQLKQVS